MLVGLYKISNRMIAIVIMKYYSMSYSDLTNIGPIFPLTRSRVGLIGKASAVNRFSEVSVVPKNWHSPKMVTE